MINFRLLAIQSSNWRVVCYLGVTRRLLAPLGFMKGKKFSVFGENFVEQNSPIKTWHGMGRLGQTETEPKQASKRILDAPPIGRSHFFAWSGGIENRKGCGQFRPIGHSRELHTKFTGMPSGATESFLSFSILLIVANSFEFLFYYMNLASGKQLAKDIWQLPTDMIWPTSVPNVKNGQ